MNAKPLLSQFVPDAEDLVGSYLQEQKNLTAVERFSIAHDKGLDKDLVHPAQSKYYLDLLPLEKPKPGEQYAFEVDLDRCSGCKACVTACHNLNGLDENETWRSVGLIHNVYGKPLQQTVTTACHHCIEPACAHGCPVKAYEKDPITGIVKHLDDQCIGCEYCILKCPYDVPQYHEEKGIVRKCDMCVGRLEVGEAPACVQACPTKAIRIQIVNQAIVRQQPEAYGNLPTAPDSTYTHPTTVYKSTRVFPDNMRAGDAFVVKREKAHSPLAWMLVLSQMAAGLFAGHLLLLKFAPQVLTSGLTLALSGLGFLIMAVAIVVSVLHLGRPLYAFRAIIGFRRSWLSREIVAFGLVLTLAGFNLLTLILLQFMPQFLFQFSPFKLLQIKQILELTRVLLTIAGVLAVFTSVMVYFDTPRVLWKTRFTFLRFYATAGLLGGTLLALTVSLFHLGLENSKIILASPALHVVMGMVIVLQIFKLIGEAGLQNHADDENHLPLKKALHLIKSELSFHWNARLYCGIFGGLLLPICWLYGANTFSLVVQIGILTLAFTLLFCGEFLERSLFFMTCVPPRMPGVG